MVKRKAKGIPSIIENVSVYFEPEDSDNEPRKSRKPCLEDAAALFEAGETDFIIFHAVVNYGHGLRTPQNGCYPSKKDIRDNARIDLNKYSVRSIRKRLELLRKYSLADKAVKLERKYLELRKIAGLKPLRL